jgi:hypothetical protein
MSLLHQTISFQRTCFETVEPQFRRQIERVLFRRPQRVTSVGFDDIAMCDFEAKLASYLVDKR